MITHFVLPLRWSLFYALTDKQWRDFRERHKSLCADWDRCECPKRCKANTLDERWKYDHAQHTKIFLGAAFICPGCHWLKTVPWRIRTWREVQDGLLPLPSKPSHIIDCLGWTQQELDALREKDLKKDGADSMRRNELNRQIQRGNAALVPAPLERLSPRDIQRFVKPGQVMIVPWRVDLTALTSYGFSPREVGVFEERMYKVAAKRMTTTPDAGDPNR